MDAVGSAEQVEVGLPRVLVLPAHGQFLGQSLSDRCGVQGCPHLLLENVPIDLDRHVSVHDLGGAALVILKSQIAFGSGAQEFAQQLAVVLRKVTVDEKRRTEQLEAEIGDVQCIELRPRLLLEQRLLVIEIDGGDVELAQQELGVARRVVHAYDRYLGQVDIVHLGKGLQHVAEGLPKHGSEPSPLEVLWATQRNIGK